MAPTGGKSPMHFLALKPWHPSNMWNQKRIWLAENRMKNRVKQQRENKREFEREQRRLEAHRLAARKGDKDSIKEVMRSQMGFMYSAPPGLEAAQEKEKVDGGDDEAVKRFKQALEAKKKRDNADFSHVKESALEKAVGRKVKRGLTLEEQARRFPELKNAPMEGEYAKGLRVQFKPVGKVLRNVQCTRCGEWGHRAGDRECRMRDFNPQDAARQQLEDPLTYMGKKRDYLDEKQKLELNPAALHTQMMANEAGGGGGHNEILLDSDDADDVEREFLQGLTKKEKKALLKKLRKEEASAAKAGSGSDDGAAAGGSRKRKRKHKEKKSKKAKKSKKSKKKRHKKDKKDAEDSA